jgi:hypothetical protein
MRNWPEDQADRDRVDVIGILKLILQVLIWVATAAIRLVFRIILYVSSVVLGFIVGFLLVRRWRQ